MSNNLYNQHDAGRGQQKNIKYRDKAAHLDHLSRSRRSPPKKGQFAYRLSQSADMKSVSFQNIHVCRLREQAKRGLSLGYISSGGSKIFERAPPREMQAIGCFSSGEKREGIEDLKTRKEFPPRCDISRCCTDRCYIWLGRSCKNTPELSSDSHPSSPPPPPPLAWPPCLLIHSLGLRSEMLVK